MVRGRLAAAFLAGVAVAAIAAPWLPLRSPAAQPDGLVLRDLPPLSRVATLRLEDGREIFASEVRGAAYRRGDTWSPVPGGATLGETRFVLGTDGFGRDLLSRLVHGARVSLAVGLLGALAAVGLGTGVGMAAGLGGPVVDAVLMRAVDVFLSVPRVFLVILLVALHGPSFGGTIAVLAATTWMPAARLIRGEVLSLKTRGFVEAARASGGAPPRVAWTHLLPWTIPILAAEGTMRIGQVLLLEAALGFLGLGVPAPMPSWGSLVADGRDSLLGAWWIATLPGAAIVLTVLAVQSVGERLEARLGPSPGEGFPVALHYAVTAPRRGRRETPEEKRR